MAVAVVVSRMMSSGRRLSRRLGGGLEIPSRCLANWMNVLGRFGDGKINFEYTQSDGNRQHVDIGVQIVSFVVQLLSLGG